MAFQNLVEIPLNFPGKLYRSPMPYARFDLGGTTLQEFLDAGITTVVMLVQEGEDLHHAGRDLKSEYASHDIKVIHYPIRDFDTPEDDTNLKKTLQLVEQRCQDGERVAVHCFAGRGRTGLFIALMARQALGLDGHEAIEFVRRYFPAIETDEQEQLVRDFEPDE